MAGCVLNSGSKGVSKVLSSHSAPLKSKKEFLPTNGQANDATKFVYVSRELTLFLHE